MTGDTIVPPIDTTVIEDLRREGGSFFLELVELFDTEVPASIRDIVESFTRNDLEAIARSAHRLKGSAVTFGAQRMSELCQEIELAARSQALANARLLFDQLTLEYSRVKEALQVERTIS